MQNRSRGRIHAYTLVYVHVLVRIRVLVRVGARACMHMNVNYVNVRAIA